MTCEASELLCSCFSEWNSVQVTEFQTFHVVDEYAKLAQQCAFRGFLSFALMCLTCPGIARQIRSSQSSPTRWSSAALTASVLSKGANSQRGKAETADSHLLSRACLLHRLGACYFEVSAKLGANLVDMFRFAGFHRCSAAPQSVISCVGALRLLTVKRVQWLIENASAATAAKAANDKPAGRRCIVQ